MLDCVSCRNQRKPACCFLGSILLNVELLCREFKEVVLYCSQYNGLFPNVKTSCQFLQFRPHRLSFVPVSFVVLDHSNVSPGMMLLQTLGMRLLNNRYVRCPKASRKCVKMFSGVPLLHYIQPGSDPHWSSKRDSRKLLSYENWDNKDWGYLTVRICSLIQMAQKLVHTGTDASVVSHLLRL